MLHIFNKTHYLLIFLLKSLSVTLKQFLKTVIFILVLFIEYSLEFKVGGKESLGCLAVNHLPVNYLCRTVFVDKGIVIGYMR